MKHTLPKLKSVPPTPFYLYSERTLRETIEQLQSLVPQAVELHFALKSNHNPKVLELFRSYGLGIDIVSGGELEFAIASGFAPEQVVFSGVGKSEAELREAVRLGVGLINIESEFELDDVVRVARAEGKQALVGFRLNPDVDAKTHPYIATGLQAHKFGISFDDARVLLQRLPGLQDAIKVRGLSMHIGSQIKDLSAIREAAFKLLGEARHWRSHCPDLTVLDLGGGLGISYEDPTAPADFSGYAKILGEVCVEWASLVGAAGRIALELGRSLVAQSGFLLTRVLGTKSNRGSHFCVVDASMTELMRPSLYQAYHEIVPHEPREAAQVTKVYDVVGPVCESSDVLGRQRTLPELNPDDVLMICSAGAYGYVLSSVYNMRRLPAEYWLDQQGNLQLVRRSLEWRELNQLLCTQQEGAKSCD